MGSIIICFEKLNYKAIYYFFIAFFFFKFFEVVFFFHEAGWHLIKEFNLYLLRTRSFFKNFYLLGLLSAINLNLKFLYYDSLSVKVGQVRLRMILRINKNLIFDHMNVIILKIRLQSRILSSVISDLIIKRINIKTFIKLIILEFFIRIRLILLKIRGYRRI